MKASIQTNKIVVYLYIMEPHSTVKIFKLHTTTRWKAFDRVKKSQTKETNPAIPFLWYSRRLQEPESEGSTAKETGRKSGGWQTRFNLGDDRHLDCGHEYNCLPVQNQFSSMFKINFIVWNYSWTKPIKNKKESRKPDIIFHDSNYNMISSYKLPKWLYNYCTENINYERLFTAHILIQLFYNSSHTIALKGHPPSS